MVGMVQSERQVNGKTRLDYRFYIGSIGGDAQRFAWAVRNHWGIENRLHWCLDIAFREDESRVRDRQAANNLAVLRHIAVNLLKKDTTIKGGLKTKRLVAGWNEDYSNFSITQGTESAAAARSRMMSGNGAIAPCCPMRSPR
jgi:predicted transposase YbfD/YdcC